MVLEALKTDCINRLTYTVFALCVLLLLPSASLAQSISLSGPSNTTVKDADEFFNDVWSAPKNFDDGCDIGSDGWYFEPESTSGGVWTGVHAQVPGPIIGIVPVPTIGSQLAYRENCGKLALNYPIDANKYTQLSFRNQHTNPSEYAVMWTKENNYAFVGVQQLDGYYLHNSSNALRTPPNTWSIKSLHMPSIDKASHTWAGEIYGVSLFSSLLQPIGGSISYDWMRLIDPATSPTINLSWTSSGSSSISANDHAVIYVDTNNSGYDGEALERGLAKSGSLNLMTGILPPGSYYFYAQFETNTSSKTSIVAKSNYIGPVTINGKPTIKITSPSRTSGQEYSAAERGDPWDMNQSTDLENLVDGTGAPLPALFKGFHNERFSGGYFQAETDFDPSMGTVDTQLHFTTSKTRQVNPRLYRYFCYDMQVDPVNLARDGDAAQLNRAGWVARLIWMNRATGALGSTKAHELIEKSQVFPDYENGLVKFCIDLWDSESYESGVSWLDMSTIDLIRFDPLEAADVTSFIINEAGLYAENNTDSNDRYEITWEVKDPENDALTVQLYYDNDNQGFNGTLIKSEAAEKGSYSWNASEVPEGKYYLYAKVSDGTNTSQIYSDVIVNVGGVSAPPLPPVAPCDFDGDGKTDATVARGTGPYLPSYWYINKSSNGGIDVYPWGTQNLDVYLGADFNGDRVTDKGLFRGRVDAFTTFLSDLSGGAGQTVQGWGIAGDVPIVADLDGDNIDDPTVFRPSDGTLWSIQSTEGAIGHTWGMYGDIPVSADFDGDNRDDLAVWRPSDGFWWILQSSKNNSTAPADIRYNQFGLPGDSPMVGDYTGDGIADLVVYRPSSGHWFVCPSETDFACLSTLKVTQFGLPGDYPIRADFDGDGTLDLAVFRPLGGYWFYIQSSNGQVGVQQHGQFGDWPLCAGPRETMQSLGHPIP